MKYHELVCLTQSLDSSLKEVQLKHILTLWWDTQIKNGVTIPEEEWDYVKKLIQNNKEYCTSLPDDLAIFAGIKLHDAYHINLDYVDFYSQNSDFIAIINTILGGGDRSRNLYSFSEDEYNYVNRLKQEWLLQLLKHNKEMFLHALTDIDCEKSEHFWIMVNKQVSLAEWRQAIKDHQLDNFVMENCYQGCRVPYRFIHEKTRYEKGSGYFYTENEQEKRYLFALAFDAYLHGHMEVASWYLKIIIQDCDVLTYLYYDIIPHDTEAYPVEEVDNVYAYFSAYGEKTAWFDTTLFLDIKNAYILQEPKITNMWDRCMHKGHPQIFNEESPLWLSC